MDQTPIACTLSPRDYKQRLASIAALNGEARRSTRQDDLTLELVYAKEALARVQDFVAREQECCAFLTFALTVESDCVRLSITAPEEARIAASAMFEQFSVQTPCALPGCCA